MVSVLAFLPDRGGGVGYLLLFLLLLLLLLRPDPPLQDLLLTHLCGNNVQIKPQFLRCGI